MPRRPEKAIEYETKDFGIRGKITLMKEEWEEVDETVKLTLIWNKEVEDFFSEKVELLKLDHHGKEIKYALLTYNSTTENKGFEKVKPRNYLAFEVIHITVGSKTFPYYLGSYEDLDELAEVIKQDFKLHYGK